MNTLPIHPTTGLQALGVLRSGRPVWPVLGGNGEGGTGQTGGDAGQSGGQAGGQQGGASEQGSDQAGGGGSGQGDGGGEPNKTFTQKELDRVVSDRLRRERQTNFGDYDELKAKAAELDKVKEATASDAEKAAKAAQKQAEAQVRGELQPRYDRLEAALRHGLPEGVGERIISASKRLIGGTADEYDADARDFFATSPINLPGAQGGDNDGGKGSGNAGAQAGGMGQGVRNRGSGAGKASSVAAGRELFREARGKTTK